MQKLRQRDSVSCQSKKEWSLKIFACAEYLFLPVSAILLCKANFFENLVAFFRQETLYYIEGGI